MNVTKAKVLANINLLRKKRKEEELFVDNLVKKLTRSWINIFQNFFKQLKAPEMKDYACHHMTEPARGGERDYCSIKICYKLHQYRISRKPYHCHYILQVDEL